MKKPDFQKKIGLCPKRRKKGFEPSEAYTSQIRRFATLDHSAIPPIFKTSMITSLSLL